VIQGQRHEFGVSGRLYKRNVLLFDRQTGSLWSQLLSQAVTGPMAGVQLRALPAENTTWDNWKNEHPKTQALSFVTGYPRNYKEDPYAGLRFPRRPALFVSARGMTRIYPYSELKKGRSRVVDQLGGHRLTILYDRRSNSARVKGEDAALTWFFSFLDDLEAFYPKTEIYHAERK
jgi:hypothetical protein